MQSLLKFEEIMVFFINVFFTLGSVLAAGPSLIDVSSHKRQSSLLFGVWLLSPDYKVEIRDLYIEIYIQLI